MLEIFEIALRLRDDIFERFHSLPYICKMFSEKQKYFLKYQGETFLVENITMESI